MGRGKVSIWEGSVDRNDFSLCLLGKLFVSQVVVQMLSCVEDLVQQAFLVFIKQFKVQILNDYLHQRVVVFAYCLILLQNDHIEQKVTSEVVFWGLTNFITFAGGF